MRRNKEGHPRGLHGEIRAYDRGPRKTKTNRVLELEGHVRDSYAWAQREGERGHRFLAWIAGADTQEGVGGDLCPTAQSEVVLRGQE